METRIGILGIEKLVEVKRPSGNFVLIPNIDVLLDVEDGNARSLEKTVAMAVEDAVKGRVDAIENLCVNIVKIILEKTNAKRVEVKMTADYVVIRQTPKSSQKTQEMYKIIGGAINENGGIRRSIGAEVTGMSSCPCAQEGLVEYSRERLKKSFSEKDIQSILQTVPVASHNQRNVSQLLIEMPEEYKIEAEKLIEILENSMSSSIYEVLKREDEVEIVLRSHTNPNFVEDIARKILVDVVKKYRNLPDDSTVFVRSESQESIHQHNAVAERISSLGTLRKEVSAP